MKIKSVVFDLETIRDDTMIPFLPPAKIGNLKDPKKIKIKQDEQISKMGLNPMLNLICCAGWCDENGPNSILIENATLAEEKELLLLFWDKLSKYDQFVTFNGRSFDIRCMLLHGITHGIRPSVKIDSWRYNRGNHIDMRLILSGDDKFAPGKLDFFCKKFLGEGKMEGIDGAMVQDYWDNGLGDDIAEYNRDEVEKMWDLFLKIKQAGLIE